MGAGLRPEAKATESPPDPNVGAPVLDSTAVTLVMRRPAKGSVAMNTLQLPQRRYS